MIVQLGVLKTVNITWPTTDINTNAYIVSDAIDLTNKRSDYITITGDFEANYTAASSAFNVVNILGSTDGSRYSLLTNQITVSSDVTYAGEFGATIAIQCSYIKLAVKNTLTGSDPTFTANLASDKFSVGYNGVG